MTGCREAQQSPQAMSPKYFYSESILLTQNTHELKYTQISNCQVTIEATKSHTLYLDHVSTVTLYDKLLQRCVHILRRLSINAKSQSRRKICAHENLTRGVSIL